MTTLSISCNLHGPTLVLSSDCQHLLSKITHYDFLDSPVWRISERTVPGQAIDIGTCGERGCCLGQHCG